MLLLLLLLPVLILQQWYHSLLRLVLGNVSHEFAGGVLALALALALALGLGLGLARLSGCSVRRTAS